MIQARRLLGTLLIIGALALSRSALAIEVGGIRLPDQVTLGGQSLVLNGAGLRVKSFFKVYAIGLYLPQRDPSASGVMAMGGAKRVHLVMMRDVRGEDLADSLAKGIEANTTPTEFGKVSARLDGLIRQVTQVQRVGKGSVVQVDFQPGIGTRIVLDGKAITTDVPGDDFIKVMLRVWLGQSVTSEDLRAALLGQPKAGG